MENNHSAHKINADEFNANDLVIVMEFAGSARDVADPWYTGDFEQTYQDVLAGCNGLLDLLER